MNARNFVSTYARRKADSMKLALPPGVALYSGMAVGFWILAKGLNWQTKRERMKRIEDRVNEIHSLLENEDHPQGTRVSQGP